MNIVISPADALTQGSRLLLPHISTLLQYLSGIVRNTDRLKKKKFRAQVAKELNILSKLVFYVNEKIEFISRSSFLLHCMYRVFTVCAFLFLFLCQGQPVCK